MGKSIKCLVEVQVNSRQNLLIVHYTDHPVVGGHQVSQAFHKPVLTESGHLVILYHILCSDGTQDDLLHDFPRY